MKVYTSYYANMSRRYQDYTVVAVSTSIPNWFPIEVPKVGCVVPGWDLVNDIKRGLISQEEYVERYKAKLDFLNRDEVLSMLREIYHENGDKPLVLCCYERPTDFCHRHYLAEWLDYDVAEL